MSEGGGVSANLPTNAMLVSFAGLQWLGLPLPGGEGFSEALALCAVWEWEYLVDVNDLDLQIGLIRPKSLMCLGKSISRKSQSKAVVESSDGGRSFGGAVLVEYGGECGSWKPDYSKLVIRIASCGVPWVDEETIGAGEVDEVVEGDLGHPDQSSPAVGLFSGHSSSLSADPLSAPDVEDDVGDVILVNRRVEFGASVSTPSRTAQGHDREGEHDLLRWAVSKG